MYPHGLPSNFILRGYTNNNTYDMIPFKMGLI